MCVCVCLSVCVPPLGTVCLPPRRGTHRPIPFNEARERSGRSQLGSPPSPDVTGTAAGCRTSRARWTSRRTSGCGYATLHKGHPEPATIVLPRDPCERNPERRTAKNRRVNHLESPDRMHRSLLEIVEFRPLVHPVSEDDTRKTGWRT